MKTITIKIDLTDAEIEALATWMGRTDGEAMAYIEKRVVDPFVDMVIGFKKELVQKTVDNLVEQAAAEIREKVALVESEAPKEIIK